MLDLDAFGVMLRQSREKRGLRPIDLALEMGWSGTAPVYRYERGGPNAPRPDPDTVNLFAQVLRLDYADRITLLGFAGHIPDTEPLTAQEEARVVEITRPSLEAMSDPALLFDYRWRILAFNAPYRALLGIDEATVTSWRAREVTTLDLAWDESLGVRHDLDDLTGMTEIQLLRFQLFNRLRRHERWFRAYPANRAHYPGFVDAWHRAEELLADPERLRDRYDVMRAPTRYRLASGEVALYEASQRNVHGAYDLIGMLVMVPITATHPT